jgi:arginine exporter protein ArgO
MAYSGHKVHTEIPDSGLLGDIMKRGLNYVSAMFGVIAIACLGGFLAGLVVQQWGVVIMRVVGFVAFGWYGWMVSPSHWAQPTSRSVPRYPQHTSSVCSTMGVLQI